MNKEDNILGIGYRSADNIFNVFEERINKGTLESIIHIPFKK